MDSFSAFSVLVLLIALIPVLYRQFTSRNPAPFPPGPKGLPILGNALDMPISCPWITFSQWGEKYGGLVYLNALGKSLVIINDAKFASAIVLKATYGYTPHTENDELLVLANEAVKQFSEMTAINAFAVDSIPIFFEVRFVPSWFPGARWKTKVDVYRRSLQRMTDRPYEWTKQALLDGSDVRGFVADQIEQTTQLTAEKETIIKLTAAGIYSGGADTSVAVIACFVLAMTLQIPQQMKAQEELDAVLGAGVLPTLTDRDRLPYSNALFTEVLRRYTSGSAGFPHVTDRDDVHEGYFIPKGTILVANTRAFFNDPKIYPDPEIFSPDRFLVSPSCKTTQQDPRDFLFGFGRRYVLAWNANNADCFQISFLVQRLPWYISIFSHFISLHGQTEIL
ncbi:Cytochrome P450 [Mycena sanguinolenta]|uniref:Cytochrome P450 n=1 Tax=Mycena sanguinolenta TaxID=230812 RepID=A0A8H7DL66_9AGAR|nr:Cytochrome P450 [Mycena sanguinolenta]